MKIIIRLSLALSFFFSINALAQHHDAEQTETHDSTATKHHAHYHKNHFAIFTGGTTEFGSDNDTHFTLGADYVRRFTETGFLGVGVFGEIVFADHTKYLLGLPLYLYPARHLWVRAGPGLEIFEESKSHSGSQSAERSSSGSKEETITKFLLRAGIGYDYEVRGFTIGPSVSVDFIESDTILVWGVNIGKGF